jgi:hypothetical protein
MDLSVKVQGPENKKPAQGGLSVGETYSHRSSIGQSAELLTWETPVRIGSVAPLLNRQRPPPIKRGRFSNLPAFQSSATLRFSYRALGHARA